MSIEQNIADTVINRDMSFRCGGRHFHLYPSSLGRSLVMARLFNRMSVNQYILSINPFYEAIRLSERYPQEVKEMIAVATFFKKEDVLDRKKIRRRMWWLRLSSTEMAKLLAIIISFDESDKLTEDLGLRKEAEERKLLAKGSNTATFGGKSIYGMIDSLCQRYSWTFDYCVWGVSFENIKLMMADMVVKIPLSERQQRHAI